MITYGIIGCGKHILHSHAVHTKDGDLLRLSALYDPSVAQMDDFEAELGSELVKFHSEEELLDSDIEAVFIGSPDRFHANSLHASVFAGKHVFCEKPLADTQEGLAKVQPALEYAGANGLIVSSCHPRRYDPPFVWLNENLRSLEESLGASLDFHFDFSYHSPSKAWKHERGLLLDHANHEIDLVHFLYGHEQFETFKVFDSFDRYHLVGLRADDMTFTFTGTRRLDSRRYPEFVHIRFEKGELAMNTESGSVKVFDHDSNSEEKIDIPKMDYPLRFRRTTDNFAKAILGQEDSYLTIEDLFVNTALAVELADKDRWTYSPLKE